MQIQPLRLAGTYEISLLPRGDERGYFMRAYDRAIFEQHGLHREWLQENQSRSTKKHIIRGLHFQKPPHAETKLVRVVAGAVLDVFVDLRKSSASYGEWDSIELTADNQKAVYIPRGFAHGFCTLTEEAVVIYKVDNVYTPAAEGGLRWNDPTLQIQWPTKSPSLSARDERLDLFSDFESPFA